MRPASIVNFERLYLGALVLGLVNTYLGWDRNLAAIRAQPGAAGLGEGFLYFTTAVSVLIPLVLWYFIARRGSVVAKWILVALFGLGLLGFIIAFANNPMFKGLTAILGTVTLVMQVVAIWMLFRPDSKPWFDDRGAPPPERAF